MFEEMTNAPALSEKKPPLVEAKIKFLEGVYSSLS